MILTSEKALKLLNQARGMAPDDYWIEHSICVGNTAGVIAKALNLDIDKAKALGYIHDIGKRNGFGPKAKPHAIGGYEYILSLDYDEEYANICLTHSYLNNDINCIAGEIPDKRRYRYAFVRDFIREHEYSIYEKIINLSDLICLNRVVVLEKRLVDIMLRHGVFSNTVYHLTEAIKLKRYFDDLLGYDLYSLFRDIDYR